MTLKDQYRRQFRWWSWQVIFDALPDLEGTKVLDYLFGLERLSGEVRSLFERYADEALVAGRYDFRMGRKLEQHLKGSGFEVMRVFSVPDAELSFDGPARQDVLSAWQDRFERMVLLHDFCGKDFAKARDQYLACLAHPEHRSLARVYCVVGK